MDKVTVIVPTYNPDESIMAPFIAALHQEFSNIVVVDDGCDAVHQPFFKTLQASGITVLSHAVNQGKGRAIKTAFNHLLSTSDFKACVTADCDGQHLITDIKACAQEVLSNPNALVLGVRDFNHPDVPKKSRFGNRTTINVFKLFIGLTLSDTQTGLRAFSPKTARFFLSVAGERYDYETKMLIACKEKNIAINEVEIATVYLNNNQTSHFHPIKDSFIIYKLFFKYILASMASFIVDISLFKLFITLFSLKRILLATVLARLLSSLVNYRINGGLIFKEISRKALIKYFALVLFVMLTSGYAVEALVALIHGNPVLLKVLVDSLLFVVCFIVQREWVFKKAQLSYPPPSKP